MPIHGQHAMRAIYLYIAARGNGCGGPANRRNGRDAQSVAIHICVGMGRGCAMEDVTRRGSGRDRICVIIALAIRHIERLSLGDGSAVGLGQGRVICAVYGNDDILRYRAALAVSDGQRERLCKTIAERHCVEMAVIYRVAPVDLARTIIRIIAEGGRQASQNRAAAMGGNRARLRDGDWVIIAIGYGEGARSRYIRCCFAGCAIGNLGNTGSDRCRVRDGRRRIIRIRIDVDGHGDGNARERIVVAVGLNLIGEKCEIVTIDVGGWHIFQIIKNIAANGFGSIG